MGQRMFPSSAFARHSLTALLLGALTATSSGSGIAVIANRFSLDPASPEIGGAAPPGQSGAHAFAGACNGALVCIPPVPYFTPPMLGLVVADNVDSFSPGVAVATTFPPPVGAELVVHYSVTPASAGAIPLIIGEVAGDGASSDVFEARYPGPVFLQEVNGVPPYPALGLMVPSDVDGWARVAPPANVQVYFTVDAPTAAAYAVSPADVFFPTIATIYATEAAMGLVPGDDIDALDVHVTGAPATWDPGELIYFSLRPGSPTLTANGWSPADILVVTPGAAPALWAPAAGLGLLATDDLNALQIFDPAALAATAPAMDRGQLVGFGLLLVVAGAWALRRRRFVRAA